MKKLSLILLVVLLISTLLSTVSCGGPDTDIPSDITPDTTTTVTNANNTTEAAGDLSVKLMTFNLRYDTTSHPCMSTEIRGAHLMEIIKKYNPDSVSFCEASNDWMNYLRVEMKKLGYEGVGVGRDSGSTGSQLSGSGNEHNPVFYRADKYKLLTSDTFWLSIQPSQKGSISWGSDCKRICTYAVLKNKESGKIYAHFGTHLDHKSVPAQYNGVMVIESYINKVLKEYGDIGIVLSGDFNSDRFVSGNSSYFPITYNTVTSFMDDSRALAKEKGVDGSSWSGYQSPTDWARKYTSANDKPTVDITESPIDYIFLQKGTATVSYYTIVDDTFTFDHSGKTWYNHPVSDHYGVFCEATFISPSATLTYSEDKIITHPADNVISETIPNALKNEAVINDSFSISSSFAAKPGTKLENMLLNDGSITSVNTQGKYHAFWEIMLTSKDPCEIKGFSVTTAAEPEIVPRTLRIFVSPDGTNWYRVGGTFAKTSSSSTYYIIPKTPITTNYVKILFSDTSSGASLSNVSLYGKATNTGRINNSDITLISGPNDASGGESYAKMFDDDTSTKFYIRLYQNNSVPANPDPVGAIHFSTKTPTTIVSYSLTNANDTASFTGRIPRKWTIYGSTSGVDGTYEIIDEVVNPNISAVNYETFTFTVDNPKEYKFYKIVFEVGSTGNVQFSEIAFFEAIE